MRTLSRFALIGVIGGGAAACSSDASRLGGPFTNPFASNLSSEPSATGSLPDSGDIAPAPAIRTGRIQSEALSAPGAAPAAASRSLASRPIQPPAQTTRVAATGPAGWSAQGGTAITVSQGDSLNQMSTRFGVPASAILSANNLTSAAQVTPGRQIVIPVYNASGMNPAATPMSAHTVPAAPRERLQFGKAPKASEKSAEKAAEKTVDKAAEAKRQAEAARKEAEARKDAESRKLAEKKAHEEAARKEADAKRHVRPGQNAKAETKTDAKTETKAAKVADKSDPKAEALKAKAEAKVEAKAEAARKAEAEAKLAKAEATKDAAKKLAEAKAAKESAEKVAKAEKTEKVAAAKPEKSEPASTGSVAAAAPAAPSEAFRWPAKGRVISGYGSSGNEGINIAVPEGTAVKAAEDGTVAYAGSDVKGYGKLVLVRHQNGYVSAYAHNGEIDVKPGEKVKRGQTIAKSGASGNVTSPQLHFEIRKGGAPVDPMSQLASN